ncbi:allophanate hydrolase [Sulfurimicrobium lacus]|uniref:Allophanate hydrolase n=1 Tax=Sulfurimicrobium lacus TaxID=2715678 RepID=A0A6F8V6K2_9PROT|nr:allophanate hydrolase [Sulfurimicrobium lacus]BCB25284.1 allophanate hydrolase [Sulfurimicrobium lacus]
MQDFSLDIASLRRLYLNGQLTPRQLVDALLARPDDGNPVWIHRLSPAELYRYADALAGKDPAALPLYGIPFAIKDNIDLAGAPTTAACPEFAYLPEKSATVVQRLIDAGAIPLGKTNLDQFATGLNGTRSPYGACRNAFDPAYISGGSSSGSAVAVATGQASFSLGTDTAGSGRVPAAFNNIVGHKPTCGWLSTSGVVPACRSLDSVSIFALTAQDAEQVLAVAAGFNESDPYSRPAQGHGFDFGRAQAFRFGVPRADQLQFFGNAEAERLFGEVLARLQALGGQPVEIDFAPFLDAARLLYEGPWVAERYAAIKDFFDSQADRIFPPVRDIIAGASRFSAADAFAGQYRLRALKREADRVWDTIDCLVTPTAGTIYPIAAMQADPIRLNANLGYYTNFMNLLDYAATAVPAGFQADGLPFGITLVAPAHQDGPLLRLAGRMQTAVATPLGATGLPQPESSAISLLPSGQVRVAVVGAHLSGLPLNWQLTQRGGRLVAGTHTAPCYRFYALPDGKRPGLVRVAEGGAAIECEVWELPASEFGSFVAGIPAPLGIGKVELEDGSTVNGFICEGIGITGAVDITGFGGWRAYLRQRDGAGA